MKMTLMIFFALVLVVRAEVPSEELSALKSRGYELEELHRYQEALEAFQQYLAKKPSDERAWMEYAGLLSLLRKHAESAKVYEEIVGRIPHHAVAHFRLAHEYLILKRFEDAKRIFSELSSSKNLDVKTRAIHALEQMESQMLAETNAEEEARIFALVKARKDQEALEGIAALERKEKVSWALQAERLYALQRQGQFETALQISESMQPPKEQENEFKLLRADLLAHAGRCMEAVAVLKEVERQKNDSSLSARAAKRRRELPGSADIERWTWGEFFSGGDYFGRLGTVIGSGSLKQGTFIPGARWIQPYAEFEYTKDTRSAARTESELGSVFSENLVGLNLGIRILPLLNENFQFYVSGGAQKDLLGIRYGGDWFPGFRAGVNGFKAWGSGSVLRDDNGEEVKASITNELGLRAPETFLAVPSSWKTASWMWRQDLFTEVGGDFSYYRRLANWIAYAQAREGMRIAQFGMIGVWDIYALQNTAFDVRGSFFDNLGEIGPGTRVIFSPGASWQIVSRVEWVQGFYFGRNDLGTRGEHSGDYKDFRVGVGVSTHW